MSETRTTADVLSLDAKALAGAVWGSPIGAKTELKYRRPHAIWPRTRAALDELVAHGYLTTSDDDGLAFRPARSCAEFRIYATKTDLTLSAMSDEAIAAEQARAQERRS